MEALLSAARSGLSGQPLHLEVVLTLKGFDFRIASEEGQKAYAEAGATPAHPSVPPLEKTRPEKIYPVGLDDLKDYPKYQKQWKETFGLR